MSRNLSAAYINKIRKMEVPNGYKFDIANYIYNPSLDNEYPSFRKILEDDGKTIKIKRIYYMKYYNGGGEYIEETYEAESNGETWQICKHRSETVLEAANRFSINHLISFCK